MSERTKEIGKIQHPTYSANVSKWFEYGYGYEGGDEWRTFALQRNPSETDGSWQHRFNTAAYNNMLRRATDLIISQIFKEGVSFIVDGLSEDNAVAFVENADRRGNSLMEFAKEVSRWAIIHGVTFVLVDTPSIAGETKADEIELGIRPYLTHIHRTDVLDWHIGDDEALEWVKIRYKKQVPRDWQTEPKDNGYEYAIYTRTGWQVVSEDGTEVKAGIYRKPPDSIPLLPVYWHLTPKMSAMDGRSYYADLLKQAVRIYNAESMTDRQHNRQGSPILAGMGQLEKGDKIDAGPDRVWLVDSSMGHQAALPEYISPGAEMITAALAYEAQRKAEFLHAAMQPNASAEKPSVQSGISKAYDLQPTENLFSEFAGNLQKGWTRITKMLAKMAGQDDSGVRADFPSDFDIRSMEMLMEQAVMYDSYTRSQTAKNELDKMLARILLPNVEMDVIKVIEREIDEGPARSILSTEKKPDTQQESNKGE